MKRRTAVTGLILVLLLLITSGLGCMQRTESIRININFTTQTAASRLGQEDAFVVYNDLDDGLPVGYETITIQETIIWWDTGTKPVLAVRDLSAPRGWKPAEPPEERLSIDPETGEIGGPADSGIHGKHLKDKEQEKQIPCTGQPGCQCPKCQGS